TCGLTAGAASSAVAAIAAVRAVLALEIRRTGVAGAVSPIATGAALSALDRVAADGGERNGDGTAVDVQSSPLGQPAVVVDWIRCGAERGVVEARDGVVGDGGLIDGDGTPSGPDATALH